MLDAVIVRVPQLNVNDEQVRIVSWLIASGEKVAKGQSVVVIETGKATVEIESPQDGYLQYSHKPDTELAVGEVLCLIGSTPTALALPAPATDSSSGADTAPPSEDTGNRPPDHPQNGKPPPGFLAEDHTLPPPAQTTNRPVGAPEPTAPAQAAGSCPPVSPRFSARARAQIEAHALDPGVFAGCGLVREEDVLRRLAGRSTPAARAPGAPGETPRTAPRSADGGPVCPEPLSRQKLAEVRALTSSCSSVLVSSVTITCRTAGLRRAAAREASLRGNATALIVFEVARLLRQYPLFNGYYHEQQACCYKRVNVGFAVDAGRGLKVLVVHDADTKTASAIADEMHELVAQYLGDQLPLKALSEGTFTISDLSGEGVTIFAPLINQGQSAILGVGAERAFAHGEGEFNLVLAFDHRLSEGRTAARFLNALRERLTAHEAALGGLSRSARAPGGANPEDLSCNRCLRAATELRRLNGFLVPSALPEGYLCNFCLGGL